MKYIYGDSKIKLLYKSSNKINNLKMKEGPKKDIIKIKLFLYCLRMKVANLNEIYSK